MESGIFAVPLNDPTTPPYDITEWNLELIRWADELGFAEAWIAEHYTIGWEAIPAPDLIIAAALRETSRIKLAPGAHLLPYHHPVSLAHRIAWLDHMAQGRYILGVGAGAFSLDWHLFDTTPARNAEMMRESLEIMTRIWTTEGPFRYEGKYWTVDVPEYTLPEAGPFLRPFQRPHPPIGITGTSPKSRTLALGGELGFEPMSLVLNPGYLRSHWETYSTAALASGKTPDRKSWRLGVEFLVADTDAEAFRLVDEGFLGRQLREYVLPKYGRDGILEFISPGTPPEKMDAKWWCDNLWLVGSPETVKDKIRQLYEQSGGFGTLILQVADYSAQRDAYRYSFELMAREVLNDLKELVPGAGQ